MTTTPSKPDLVALAPCPFCGGPATARPLPSVEDLARMIQQFWQSPSGRAWDGDDKSCCVALPAQADWFRRLATAILTLLGGSAR